MDNHNISKCNPNETDWHCKNEPRDWLKTCEVAELFGVTPQKITAIANKRNLRTEKNGKYATYIGSAPGYKEFVNPVFRWNKCCLKYFRKALDIAGDSEQWQNILKQIEKS